MVRTGSFAVAADHRVALVIGNGDYLHADKLANPVRDARNIRDALGALHFEVTYGENLAKRDLERTIGHFAAMAQDADVALIYFAGHGATFGDIPYVVPVDAEFTSVVSVPYDLVPIEALVGELRRAKGVRIVILDACRDNSAERALKRTASRGGDVSRGLARIKNPEGLIIAYATQYLDTAADGDANGDSPFTGSLLRHLATPGLDVKDLFFEVGREVTSQTGGLQRPEISISFYDPFTLVPSSTIAPRNPVTEAAPKAMPTLTPSTPVAADVTPWTLIKDRNDPGLLREFIKQFPTSTSVPDARKRFSDLDDAAWSRAQANGGAEALRAYTVQFPDGTHSAEAASRLAKLETKPSVLRKAEPKMSRKPVALRPNKPRRAIKQARRTIRVQPRTVYGDEDPLRASFAVYPPRTMGFGATVQMTSRSGRRMTCVGGNGYNVQRRCSWND